GLKKCLSKQNLEDPSQEVGSLYRPPCGPFRAFGLLSRRLDRETPPISAKKPEQSGLAAVHVRARHAVTSVGPWHIQASISSWPTAILPRPTSVPGVVLV
ncbi:hypothetical protein GGTG_14384, partial [Gaeumannomyces tritici R3-111a-1]